MMKRRKFRIGRCPASFLKKKGIIPSRCRKGKRKRKLTGRAMTSCLEGRKERVPGELPDEGRKKKGGAPGRACAPRRENQIGRAESQINNQKKKRGGRDVAGEGGGGKTGIVPALTVKGYLHPASGGRKEPVGHSPGGGGEKKSPMQRPR